MKKWSNSEIDILRKYYSKIDSTELDKMLPRWSHKEIYGKARSLNLTVKKNIVWAQSEIEILKKYYGKEDYDSLKIRLPGKTFKQISSKAAYLKLKSNSYWTTAEDETIRTYYQSETATELSKRLPGRSIQAIQGRTATLGLSKVDRSDWTIEEIDILKKYYPIEETIQVAKRLPNRSYSSIVGQARKYGIHKASIKKREVWSEAEIDILKKFYNVESIDDIQKRLPNRSKKHISAKASQIGLTANKFWSEDEDDYLKSNYGKQSAKEMSNVLIKRSPDAIRNRAVILGLTSLESDSTPQAMPVPEVMLSDEISNSECTKEIEIKQNRVSEKNKRKKKKKNRSKAKSNRGVIWTSDEDQIVEKFFFNEELNDLVSRIPNHTAKEIQKRAKQLGLNRNNPLKRWTSVDLDTLKTYYPIEGTAVFYRLKRFSINAIKAAAKNLKLKPNRITEPWDYEEDFLACKFYLEHLDDWNQKEIIDNLLDIFISNGYLNHKQKTLHMKLANCSYIHTGIGLEHASKQNIKVYDKLTRNNWFKKALKKIKRFFIKLFK